MILKEVAGSQCAIFLFKFFLSLRLVAQAFAYSLDYLIRSFQHADWNCQTNLFCRLEVNDEFKLCRLLHGQISRFGTFQDLVHVNSRAPIEVSEVRPIGHETAYIDILLLWVDSRQPVFAGKLDDPLSFGEKAPTGSGHNRAHLLLLYSSKGALQTFGVGFHLDLL
jgi:hypothetical protein